MCGILGLNWQDEKLTRELNNLLKHRGPDQEGFYFDSSLSLGHRRLSILDLSSKGNQPMKTDDGSLTIIFNGEIFNFLEIKKSLQEKGYQFKSKSDTEVLLLGYKEYGKEIVDKLNGQFAFCIYDKPKQRLFLARDRVGINPLYYFFDGNKFIFGSEMKVILKSGIKRQIDQFALNYYLMYGHTPRKKTILKNCFKIEPGYFLVFDLKEKKIEEYKKYWDFSFSRQIKDEEQAKKLILEQLGESIKKRMVADVPVGAFLSGGIDSSAVVAMMSRETDNLNTFSIQFDHNEFDESHYAEIVSKKFGTNHHVIKFSVQDVKNLIPKLALHYDEPFADSSMIPTFLVSQVARKHVTVSLSGDGGDELFGGYSSYQVYKWIERQKFYPKFLNHIFLFLLDILKIEKLIKLKKFFRIGLLPKEFKFAEFRNLLYKEDFDKLIDDDPKKYYQEYIGGYFKKHWLDQVINIDIHNYLEGDILTKVDRASLGNSLESRPPILDHKMVELAAKISPELKIKGGEAKYIFKKAFEEILPEEIVYRKKQGFSVPLKYYLRNELKDLVEKYVINYEGHNLYKKEMILEIKERLEEKKWHRNHARIIWSLLMFNLWYDKWILEKNYEG